MKQSGEENHRSFAITKYQFYPFNFIIIKAQFTCKILYYGVKYQYNVNNDKKEKK